MHIWHLTYASTGRNPLFADEAACRKAIRVLGRVVGTSTVLFSIVDNHLHTVLWCDRQRCRRLARALVQTARRVASVPVKPARVRAVENRAHMKWLVDNLLSQTIHHGIPAHPSLRSGSCFPDLIGARWVPGLALQLLDEGPRTPRRRRRRRLPGEPVFLILKKEKFRTPRRQRPPIPPALRTDLADNCMSVPWEKDENRTPEMRCPVAR